MSSTNTPLLVHAARDPARFDAARDCRDRPGAGSERTKRRMRDALRCRVFGCALR